MGNEFYYYDTLRRIGKEFMTSEQIAKRGEKMYGCSAKEVLEMAYDNMQDLARKAIKGKRKPKV